MTSPPPRYERVPVTDKEGRVTRYRLERPKPAIIEMTEGHFEATQDAERREGWHGRYAAIRDRALGSTLSNARLDEERLSKRKALAVFSSDAISSVAYATQEILFVLILAGAAGTQVVLPIAIGIVLLLGIVVVSYRETIMQYPSGGGAYIVARENLGTGAGLVAAAALLIDYVLTVSVSIAAGIDALASLNSAFRPYAVELAVVLVALVALINLRGVRESGTIFAIPTYAFIGTLAVAIVVALIKIFAGGENALSAGAPATELHASESLTLFLILRAFANGCTAMTGVEAISNGVQVFKTPAPVNANRTLAVMTLILGSLFLGVTIVARHHGFIPSEDATIPSQLGAEAFGRGSPLFAFLQIMTAGILVLAANTAFAGFPRLAAIVARDGFLPRVLQARGNRLVFSYGIVALASVAALLIVVFHAETTRLIPLYALGVFIGFTLSQAGMVRHWLRTKSPGWQRKAATNGFGATATGTVAIVILFAKFHEGAWIVTILLPVLAFSLWSIGRFYRRLRRNLFVAPEAVFDLHAGGASTTPIVVPVEEVNVATVMAISSACERSSNVRAVHVKIDPDEPAQVAERWHHQFPRVPLVVIDSPYRLLADPIARYVEELAHQPPYEVEVMVPVVEVRHAHERPLVNQSLKRLQKLLSGRPRIRVSTLPYAEGGPRRRSIFRRSGLRGA